MVTKQRERAAPAAPQAGEEDRWRAVVERDRRADGTFVFAVRSTGVYCRPSCPARRPRRDRVLFFPAPAAAAAAGFRPCRRCRPDEAPADARWAREVCTYLEARLEEPPDLAALGAAFGMSPSHLLRRFRRLAGVTPRQYVQARRLERVKDALREGGTVTEALYEAGYGSSRGLYESAGARLGMTPARYRRRGQGLRIRYTVVEGPLGRLLLAGTDRGVCAVYLGDSDAALAAALAEEYPAAVIARDDEALAAWARLVVRRLEEGPPDPDLPLDVQATAFQALVWEALRRIPYGTTRTYREIAELIGRPGAARAVGRACATNPVSILVPCHRAVRADGALGGYRWGLARKQALLEQERRAAGPRAEGGAPA